MSYEDEKDQNKVSSFVENINDQNNNNINNNNQNQIGENIMNQIKNYGLAKNYNDAIFKLSLIILPLSFFTSFERNDLWSILNVFITIGILKQIIPIKYSQYLVYSMCLNLIIEIVWTFLNLGNLTEGILFFLNIIFGLLEIFIQVVILLLYWKDDYKNVDIINQFQSEIIENNENKINDQGNFKVQNLKKEKSPQRLNPADINKNFNNDGKNYIRNWKEDNEP
jgi:hypothetical protein